MLIIVPPRQIAFLPSELTESHGLELTRFWLPALLHSLRGSMNLMWQILYHLMISRTRKTVAKFTLSCDYATRNRCGAVHGVSSSHGDPVLGVDSCRS